ncbi:hypothetical protein JCM10207_009233 [Rhodosporidiobolus poonsookiae]
MSPRNPPLSPSRASPARRSSPAGSSSPPPRPLASSSPPPSAAVKPQAKPRPTHFLALPLSPPSSPAHAALASSLSDLRTSFPSLSAAIRPPGTVHLTLGVLSLRGQRGQGEVERAKRALEEEVDVPALWREVQGEVGGSLEVDLVGLRTLPRQNPKSASVLFAAPVESGGEGGAPRLQRFAEAVRSEFVRRGLVQRETEVIEVEVEEDDGRGGKKKVRRKEERDRPVLLHATLVNGVYAKPRGRGRGRGAPDKEEKRATSSSPCSSSPAAPTASAASSSPPPPPPEPHLSSRGRFDARPLLASPFSSTVWARAVRVEGVALCEMGARKISGKGKGEGGKGGKAKGRDGESEEEREVVDEVYRVVAWRALPD